MCCWKEGLEILKGLGMNAKGGAALEAAGDTESSTDWGGQKFQLAK